MVPSVCSTTILDGADDSFGEDDHMAHHHFGGVSHDRLAVHQRSQAAVWARHGASVFHNLSGFELGCLVMLRRFRTLAGHYVDFSGKKDADEIERLLAARASRTEISYADYEFGYLPGLGSTVSELVRSGVCASENEAYRYQAGRLPAAAAPV